MEDGEQIVFKLMDRKEKILKLKGHGGRKTYKTKGTWGMTYETKTRGKRF